MAVRGRTLGAVLAGLLACLCAFALDPALDVSQYAHKAWKNSDGFSKGIIYSIAQTPDGYLWLGTEFGLLRFDGVRPTEWAPPAGGRLPADYVRKVLVTRDGTLWIGTVKGLASWKGGRLTQHTELAGWDVFTLLEDREGTLWAGGYGIPYAKLCAIHGDSTQCYGEDGSLGQGVLGLYEDSHGSLWVGMEAGLLRWKPGGKFYPRSDPNGTQGLAEGEDGNLLISMPGGVRRLVDGRMEMAYPFPRGLGQYSALKLLRDRDRGLWVGTVGGGLVHVHEGRTDVFSQSVGLSGDVILSLFEDREGSIWVSTVNGLDRFRNFAAATFSVSQGLPGSGVMSVLAAKDGTVWFNAVARLSRFDHGNLSVYHERAQSRPNTVTGVREIAGSGLPDSLESLFQDDRGRIWVATIGGVGYLEDGRFLAVKDVPPGFVSAITEDSAGNLWMASQDAGLLHLLPGGGVRQIPWARLGHKDSASALTGDLLHGGLWVGFLQGGISYLQDDQVRVSYMAADGLGEGRVNEIRLDPDGMLWAATEGGFSRLMNGHVVTLTSKSGLPCDAVHWVLEDDDHSFWLGMACGLVRVARPEFQAWASEPRTSGSGRTIQTTVFDSSDGIRSHSFLGGFSPHAARSTEGKLWFATPDGLVVIDPHHLPFNKLPPPISIEQVTADRKIYDANANGRLRLPPLIRNLQIDYTALSLVAPEKMRFRYKLEGHDTEWTDAGPRRQAFYNDLAPRNYRFRVIASNNDGVWNEAGASLDFSVAPAYYQTTWFLALVVAAVLAVLTGLHRLRLLYLTKQFNARLEGRVTERTRVARDLHDTLLQSFQGVLLKFSAVKYVIRSRPPHEAEEALDRVIDQARAAVTEGRDAVQGLRSSIAVANDLARAITTFGEGFVADQAGPNRPEFRAFVEGKSKELPPLIRDEVYKIACESLRNAFRHAEAKQIEVQIRYEPRQFWLQIVDNGKGIAPAVLSAGGRAGHHGLPGLHERAELAGGKLSVWSQLNSGTKIELAIPSSIAYPKPTHPGGAISAAEITGGKTAGGTNAKS